MVRSHQTRGSNSIGAPAKAARGQNGDQRQGGRQRLPEQDRRFGGRRAENARAHHKHAAEKEDLDRSRVLPRSKAPDESGSQETVVETLVGGKHGGRGRDL